MPETKIPASFLLSCLQKQLEDDSAAASLNQIDEMLKSRIDAYRQAQARDVESEWFLDELEEARRLLRRLDELLGTNVFDEEDDDGG